MLGAWLLAESTTGHDAHSCGLQQLEGVPARGSSNPPSTTTAVQLDYTPIQNRSCITRCASMNMAAKRREESRNAPCAWLLTRGLRCLDGSGRQLD